LHYIHLLTIDRPGFLPSSSASHTESIISTRGPAGGGEGRQGKRSIDDSTVLLLKGGAMGVGLKRQEMWREAAAAAPTAR
jgi:hypothetical protein